MLARHGGSRIKPGMTAIPVIAGRFDKRPAKHTATSNSSPASYSDLSQLTLKGLTMTRFSNLMLSATLACCAASAQAGTTFSAADARITNGGTGFIGVTESAGRPAQHARWNADSSSILRGGEASTFVNGRPNEDPYAPGMGAYPMGAARAPMTGELRTMGGSRVDRGVAGAPEGAHPAWGTPD
jgi:hypothetical protein